jgi:hypothetical protein
VARRLALLVATYRYQDSGLRQLAAPGHDAEALAEVLRDPEIAGFDVTVLVNEPHHIVGETIGEFYHNRRRDDLVLLYFTGHGLKDDQGRLYLAMTNTKRDGLLFTALSAQQIDDAMESCSSRQKILVLDCCYSGAFPAGRIAKTDPQVHTLEKFQGKGRVVLTASDATQYSFEGNEIIGQGTRSVFTRFLVEGLTTGDADLDSDGDISLDELYSYVHDRVVEEMPQQRPKKQENVEGRIVIARNINWRLPAYVRNAIESPFARDRLAALESLAQLHRGGNDLVRVEVINQACRLIHDTNKAVSGNAMKLIMVLDPEQARREVEEQARQKAAEEEPRWVPAVTSTPPHLRANDQDKKQVVTSPPLSSPVHDTTASTARLEQKISGDQQIETRTGPLRAAKASQEAEGKQETRTQVGGKIGSTESWRLGRLNHNQVIAAVSAALIILVAVVAVVIAQSMTTVSTSRTLGVNPITPSEGNDQPNVTSAPNVGGTFPAAPRTWAGRIPISRWRSRRVGTRQSTARTRPSRKWLLRPPVWATMR